MIQEFIWACPLCGAESDRARLNCVCCGDRLTLQGLDRLATQPPVVQPRKYNYEVQVRCEACKGAFPAYLCEAEGFELLVAVRKALADANYGRNPRCWPLISFGYKDADLEASGCTGIRRIIGVELNRVLFEVGGHKTVVDSDCLPPCDEKYREEYDEWMRDYVCGSGFTAEHDGDGAWMVSFEDVIAVELVLEDGKLDGPATAEKIITEAKTRTDPFAKEMAGLSKIGDHLFTSACADIMRDAAVEAGPNDLAKLEAALQDVYGESNPGVKILMDAILQSAQSKTDFTATTWKGTMVRHRHKFAELMGDFDYLDPPEE